MAALPLAGRKRDRVVAVVLEAEAQLALHASYVRSREESDGDETEEEADMLAAAQLLVSATPRDYVKRVPAKYFECVASRRAFVLDRAKRASVAHQHLPRLFAPPPL